MKCTRPVTLTSPEGTPYTVPCGCCPCCKVNRTEEWAIRIIHESKMYNENVFVTLTYNDENLPNPPSVSKREVQLFLKRLRKAVFPKRFRYFACGEYGDRDDRPHYHVIVFGMSANDKIIFEKCWNQGWVRTGPLNEVRARYTAKYTQKQLYGAYSSWYTQNNVEKEFMLCSRQPGIGFEFSQKYLPQWLSLGFLTTQGVRRPIPKYYLSKVNDFDLTYYKIERRKKAAEHSEAIAREKGLNYYQMVDKEVRDNKNREVNVQARIDLKKSEL